MGARLVAEIYAALESQTVVVPGSAAAETVLPKLADSLKETLLQRKTIGADVERMLDAHPLFLGPDLDARRRNHRQLHASFSKSVTVRHSHQPDTSPPTPASHP